VKDSVNGALGEAQEALKGTDSDKIKAAVEKLATESQKLGAALYQQQGADGAAAGAPGAEGAAKADAGADDVVDAEIVDEDTKK
ncbi:MAG TPA: molecular chaperone DnaK, partial [Pseudonocardia sp.]